MDFQPHRKLHCLRVLEEWENRVSQGNTCGNTFIQILPMERKNLTLSNSPCLFVCLFIHS